MEKLSHAYIISSPSGKRRREEAIALAMQMLCSAQGRRPCGVCRDCRKVKNEVHPDLSFISRALDDKGNKKREIQVNQIRGMAADAAVLPNEAAAKVYIIEDADTMNENAQNAALKLFEEPPENVSFILCVENIERLLITVRSRCVERRCAAEDEQASEEAEKMAREYVRVLDEGNDAQLVAWCMENEGCDQRRLTEFLVCAKRELTERLKTAPEGRKTIMDNIDLLDRCAAYLRVNTGVKHIFGLLAVRSQVGRNGV